MDHSLPVWELRGWKPAQFTSYEAHVSSLSLAVFSVTHIDDLDRRTFHPSRVQIGHIQSLSTSTFACIHPGQPTLAHSLNRVVADLARNQASWTDDTLPVNPAQALACKQTRLYTLRPHLQVGNAHRHRVFPQ